MNLSDSKGASRTPRAGDAGELSCRPLPVLLLDLYRSRFSGALELARGKTIKRIVLQDGAPVLSESNLGNETLGVQLMDQGTITGDDHQRVSSYMKRKDVKEGVALLALELLKPKDLFHALKEQVRRRVIEAFGWTDGSYTLTTEADLDNSIKLLRSNPLSLIREGLLNHWTPDRLLTDLTDKVEQYPMRTKSFDEAERHLASDNELAALFDGIDGTQTLGAAIGGGFNSLDILTTAWILSTGDLVRFQTDPIAELDTEGETAESDFEIEVVVKDSTTKSASDDDAPRDSVFVADNKPTDAADAMRAEVLERLEGLEEGSYYELLGLNVNATDGEIRKAYFTAAKRFHPDALNHLGLTDVKDQAAKVFAKIAEANDVLRDPEKRAHYDARCADDAPDIDTQALAQAETFYRKGEILVRMGDFRGALEYLESCVELWSEECAYQSTLGWALYKQPKSDTERALVHLEKAVELDDADPVARFRLGMVLRASGDEDRGASCVAAAKQLDPTVS